MPASVDPFGNHGEINGAGEGFGPGQFPPDRDVGSDHLGGMEIDQQRPEHRIAITQNLGDRGQMTQPADLLVQHPQFGERAPHRVLTAMSVGCPARHNRHMCS
ncbi:hypothetical protein [Nocardia niigatensis]